MRKNGFFLLVCLAVLSLVSCSEKQPVYFYDQITAYGVVRNGESKAVLSDATIEFGVREEQTDSLSETLDDYCVLASTKSGSNGAYEITFRPEEQVRTYVLSVKRTGYHDNYIMLYTSDANSDGVIHCDIDLRKK